MTARLRPQERTVLLAILSSPKPWDGVLASSLKTPYALIQKLFDRGLLRTNLDASPPIYVRDDTRLWLTPEGRAAAAETHASKDDL
jgi:hypothetical protein